jgi:hypothetical protein
VQDEASTLHQYKEYGEHSYIAMRRRFTSAEPLSASFGFCAIPAPRPLRSIIGSSFFNVQIVGHWRLCFNDDSESALLLAS